MALGLGFVSIWASERSSLWFFITCSLGIWVLGRFWGLGWLCDVGFGLSLGCGVRVSGSGFGYAWDVRFRLGVYGLSLSVTPIAPNHQAVPPKTRQGLLL